MATVGLAIIAKNEEENLPHLLESIKGAFDEVVLVDTGSTDGTVEVFTDWCVDNDQAGDAFPFEWCDDFSAARNYADSLLTTDWKVWADCDDVIVGAQNIRRIVDSAPDDLHAFVCGYDYAQHPDTGTCICFLWRERIVRNGTTRWVHRVHEAQEVQGPTRHVPPETLLWRHRKMVAVSAEDAARRSNKRNLRILRKWNDDEPNNPRTLAYLGTEYAVHGNHKTAVGYYKKYLALPTGWAQERAQVCRKLCVSLISLERYDEARKYAFVGMDTDPAWPDSYLTLAELDGRVAHHDRCITWARRAASIGQPQTLLIINPLDYTFLPLRYEAISTAGLGDFDRAIELGSEALDLAPDPELFHLVMEWKAVAKRERTASQYMMCAEQLVAHDEQIKALTLLTECVPHFAIDHPRVAGMRSWLRERIAWANGPDELTHHYSPDGVAKEEDLVPDDKVDLVCEALSRTGFLLDGVLEQVGV